jgi:hypothetical protein
MRNPDYCLYGFAKSKRERSAESGETQFNQLSLQVGRLLPRCVAPCIVIKYWHGLSDSPLSTT